MSRSRVLLACCLLFVPVPLLAEVCKEWPGGTLVLGSITDDPNPVGVWFPYRPCPPDRILNSSGDARGDGVPEIIWRENAWPIAVWSYNAGTDGDIAYSEWDGVAWTATEFLTSGTTDELDPGVFAESDGTVHVVWWTSGATEEVHLSTRAAGTSVWGTPILVTPGAESGRRPAVVVDAGTIRVVYERSSTEPGMSQDIVVATQVGGGSFTTELVASTPRTDVLHPIIHAEDGKVWVDWIHDTQDFGCVEKDPPGWSPLAIEPWADPSWIGVEEMRKAIRRQVLDN